jgi:hypothetical protein
MDWFDLRNHLINVHGADENAVDDLTPLPDGVAGRRRHPQDLHLEVHRESIHPQRPTA